MKLTQENYDALMMDPRYLDIGGLPSNSKGYEFKNLYIRPFGIHELKLISRAASLKEPQHVIRAIDLTISEDINILTVGDYYYLLMWHKLHSYTKTPLIVEWPCPMSVWHRKRDGTVMLETPSAEQMAESEAAVEVEDKFVFEPCNTLNSEPVSMVNIEVVSLEDDFVLPEGLDFPRVGTMLAVDEMMQDPDLQFLVPALQWMPGNTMEDKMKRFEGSPDLDLFQRATKANQEIVHGVKQTTILTCRKCRSRHPYTVKLDPLSFFL